MKKALACAITDWARAAGSTKKAYLRHGQDVKKGVPVSATGRQTGGPSGRRPATLYARELLHATLSTTAPEHQLK